MSVFDSAGIEEVSAGLEGVSVGVDGEYVEFISTLALGV